MYRVTGDRCDKLFGIDFDESDEYDHVMNTHLTKTKLFVRLSVDGCDYDSDYHYGWVMKVICPETGTLIARLENCMFYERIDYNEDHDLLLLSSYEVALFPKFERCIQNGNMNDEYRVVLNGCTGYMHNLDNFDFPINPCLLRIIYPNLPDVETKFYYAVAFGSPSVLIAVIEANTHELLKIGLIQPCPNMELNEKYCLMNHKLNVHQSRSGSTLKITMLEERLRDKPDKDDKRHHHHVVQGQLNLPGPEADLEDISIDSSLIEGGKFDIMRYQFDEVTWHSMNDPPRVFTIWSSPNYNTILGGAGTVFDLVLVEHGFRE